MNDQPSLTQAWGEWITADDASVKDGFGTLLSDRVIAALFGENAVDVDAAQAALARAYMVRLSRAPAEAAAAARGEVDAPIAAASAFALGQVALAQNVVAQVAARLVDDDFEGLLLSNPYEKYVRTLIDKELSGIEIAGLLEKDEAEVSRRLKVLRQGGAVEFRREGNRIVNFLTQAARVVVRKSMMGAIGSSDATHGLSQEVAGAVHELWLSLPEHVQSHAVLAENRMARVGS